jgi:hypothetical protein
VGSLRGDISAHSHEGKLRTPDLHAALLPRKGRQTDRQTDRQTRGSLEALQRQHAQKVTDARCRPTGIQNIHMHDRNKARVRVASKIFTCMIDIKPKSDWHPKFSHAWTCENTHPKAGNLPRFKESLPLEMIARRHSIVVGSPPCEQPASDPAPPAAPRSAPPRSVTTPNPARSGTAAAAASAASAPTTDGASAARRPTHGGSCRAAAATSSSGGGGATPASPTAGDR